MADRVSTVRDELHAALVAGLSTAAERVVRQPPAQPVPPTVWVDTPDILSTGGGLITLRFPVFAVADGDDQKQVQWLDETSAQLWDAIEGAKGWTCDGIVSQPVATGLGTGRGVVASALITIAARTLCPPPTLTT